jgi:hypothetical protein
VRFLGRTTLGKADELLWRVFAGLDDLSSPAHAVQKRPASLHCVKHSGGGGISRGAGRRGCFWVPAVGRAGAAAAWQPFLPDRVTSLLATV